MKLAALILVLLVAGGCVESRRSSRGDVCLNAGGSEVSCEQFVSELRVKELTMPVTIDESHFTLGSFPMPAQDENFHCGLSPLPYKSFPFELRNNQLFIETDGIRMAFGKDDGKPYRLQGLWIAISSTDRRVSSQSIQFNGDQVRIQSVCK